MTRFKDVNIVAIIDQWANEAVNIHESSSFEKARLFKVYGCYVHFRGYHVYISCEDARFYQTFSVAMGNNELSQVQGSKRIDRKVEALHESKSIRNDESFAKVNDILTFDICCPL